MLLKKILLGITGSLVVIGLVTAGSLYAFYNVAVKPAPTETITIGDGKTMRVGIISDTQLAPTKGKYPVFTQHLLAALKILKEQKVDMIIHAGDVGDMNSTYAYNTYNDAIDTVFGEEKPETLYIMGNHDNWWNSDYNTSIPKARKFAKKIGESPWTHKVVNGFHFIGVSPDETSNKAGYSEKVLAWMDAQIKEAHDDNPDQPIFVVTHHNPKDTTYGSDEWYDPNLDAVMSKYSNVVSMSGHSHYSILDERSIYQNQYTSFTTQGLAYIELEAGKSDAFKGGKATIPPRDEDYPMMLIMNVGQNDTTLERWNVTDNKEEKADKRWILNYPLTPETFTYSTAKREAINKAPAMPNTQIRYNPAIKSTLKEPKEGQETLQGITFETGTDDDFVHSYKVILRGQKEVAFECFSDYYNGIDNMAKEVNVPLSATLLPCEYTVQVYAIDSYGLVSPTCAQGTITLR